MGVEANNAVRELNKSIDGNLTNTEKKTFIDAYRKDKRGILEASQNKLRKFIISDYSQRSYDLVGKSGVKAFQKFAKISPDGDYGPNTFRAIVQYQERNGLKVDGIIGSETLKAISGGKPSSQNKVRTKTELKEEKKTQSLFSRLFRKKEKRKPLSIRRENSPEQSSGSINYPPRNKTQAKQLQTLLQKEGHYKSSIDGDFGNGSKKALQSFLRAKGYYAGPIDANIGGGTLRAIQGYHSGGPKLKISRKVTSQKNNEINNEKLPKTNREFINKYVPKEWKKQFIKFASTLKPREILSPKDPITVCDSRTNRALFIVNGKAQEMKVGFGVNGFSDGYVGTNDKKTPRGIVTRFSSVNIPKDPYGDASNSGSKTLKGAALMGSDTVTTKKVRLRNGKLAHKQTGKWHHGVVDRRVGRNDSNGCVTYSVHDIRKIAISIRGNKGKGYGYVA